MVVCHVCTIGVLTLFLVITQAVQAPKTIAPESAPGSMMEQAENTQL